MSVPRSEPAVLRIAQTYPRAGLTCLGFPKMILIPDFLQKNEVGEEYSYMFQGLIQQLKASVDFSWMLAPALHKRKEM